ERHGVHGLAAAAGLRLVDVSVHRPAARRSDAAGGDVAGAAARARLRRAAGPAERARGSGGWSRRTGSDSARRAGSPPAARGGSVRGGGRADAPGQRLQRRGLVPVGAAARGGAGRRGSGRGLAVGLAALRACGASAAAAWIERAAPVGTATVTGVLRDFL